MTKKEKQAVLLSEMPLMELYKHLSLLGTEELAKIKEQFEELIECLDVFAVGHLHDYIENKKDNSLGLYVHCNANMLALVQKVQLVNDFEKIKAEFETKYEKSTSCPTAPPYIN